MQVLTILVNQRDDAGCKEVVRDRAVFVGCVDYPTRACVIRLRPNSKAG